MRTWSFVRGLGVTLAAFSLVGLSAGAAGCGPDKKEPNIPKSPADAGSGSAVNDDKGQQVGISGGPDARADLTGDAKEAYDRGFKAWMNGDLQVAKQAFADAAQKAPKSGAPHYSLGTVLERLGDTSGAQQEYRQAFTVQPSYEFAMGALAISLARTGHAGEAETFLQEKLQKSPDSVRLMTYLSEVKSIGGDSAAAQKLAQDALAKKPDYKEAMIAVARDYYRGRRFDVAKYALQAILVGSEDGSIPPRDKDNAEAHLLRGLIARELGERRSALEDFEAAVAKRPDLFEAYINLGEMKLEAGNATEGLPPLEKAVKYAPNVAIAHLNLGEAYRLLGRAADAKREFETALAQDSSLSSIHYNLGLLYLFSPKVPGVSDPEVQVAQAIKELEMFKTMRGAKPARGQGDDVDELLATAKRKQGELKLKKAAANPPPPPPAAPTGDAGAAPAPAPAGDAGKPK